MEAKRRKPNRKSVPTKLQNGSHAQSVIMVEIETIAPISDLQKIIGVKLNSTNLENYEIYLQDIPLDPKFSLYDQAVRVSGRVELKVQIETHNEGRGRLTIVEIAKNMTDDEIKALGGQEGEQAPSRDTKTLSHENGVEKDDDLGIPCDPTLWTQEQVHSWMLWIAKGYNLDPSMVTKPGIDGNKLCILPIEHFLTKFPYGNIFWSHLSFLKKLSCPDINDNNITTGENDTALNLVVNDRQTKAHPSSRPSQPSVTVHITNEPSSHDQSSSIEGSSTGVSHSSYRSHGGGGQIQLWQFLLELLTDADEQHVITWVGDDGGFKFLDPEKVARKWGERKAKPAMNYEKLSRALRYYYDGDMISKVAGKRFEYKFVCNLKEILGYDAAELHKMVKECYEKRQARTIASEQVFSNVTGVIENGKYFPR